VTRQQDQQQQSGRRRDRGATVTARRRRDGDGMPTRLRAHAVPHMRMTAVAAAGTGAQLASMATGAPATVAAVTTVGGATTVGLVALARRRSRRMTGREVAGWLAAAGWCGWVAAAGWSLLAALLLAVTGVAGHLRYWRSRRLPDPPVETGPAPVDLLDPATMWADHIGSAGGALPGSSLSGEERIATGRRYRLHLVPGRQTLAQARAEMGRLRSGLRLQEGQDIAIEPGDDEATGRLTLIERSPVLTSDNPWPGGTYDPDSGTVAIGPYVDGDGTARWRLHSPGSLWGGYVAGSIGSGKSRLLESLALGAASAGMVVWWADGQDGTSSPWLSEHADWSAAGVDGIRTMLTAARQVKRLRQLGNVRAGWSGWSPDQGRPGLVIMIDECHVPMSDPECQEIATELAREGRKVGITLVLASQVATLDAFGGKAGADALRSSVCAGQMLVMRSMTRTTRSVLPGVEVDPTTYPAIAGYGWLVDHTGERRSAPCRSYFLDDHVKVDAGQAVVWSPLEPDAAAAAGADYARRRDDGARMAEIEAAYAALVGGAGPAALPTSPAPVSPAVPTFPAPVPVPDQRTGPATTGAGDDGDQGERLTPAAVAVRDVLRDGPATPGELRTATGYGETRIRQATAELAAAGLAQRDGARGPWSLVDQEMATARP